MAQRLPVVRLKPQRVIDWGAHLGASYEPLLLAYPQARLLAVEPDETRRAASAAMRRRPWWPPSRWGVAAPEAVLESALSPGQGQLLWANMALHGAIDPQAVMMQWHRALEVGGFLMFSTLGPGTLQGLRDVYAQQGWPVPHAPFVDMHDLGDMLLEAGFAGPVMDQEQVILTWPSAEALLAELRELGGNVDPRRMPGLRTPRWRRHLCELLSAGADAGGRVQQVFEVVYGHALRPAPRHRLAQQTSVPLEELRAMARAGRRQP